MSRRLILQLILSVKLVTAADELAVVREREDALANAVDAKDRAALVALTDKDFNVSWSYGSVFRNFRADANREEWIEGLSHLRIESYKIEILRVDWAGRIAGRRKAASVTLDELFTLRSPQGRRIQKRVETGDMWIEQQDAWKLASRVCHSDAHY